MKSKNITGLLAVTMILGSFAAATPAFARGANGGGGQGGGGESPLIELARDPIRVNSTYPRRRNDRESCGRHYGYNEVAQTYVGADGMMHFCQVR